MAQDFRVTKKADIPTTEGSGGLLWTGGNYDAVIGIRLCNIHTSEVTVDVYVKNSSTTYYIAKGTSITPGGSLELIQGGAKIVMESGDTLYAISNTSSAIDAIASVIDTISS